MIPRMPRCRLPHALNPERHLVMGSDLLIGPHDQAILDLVWTMLAGPSWPLAASWLHAARPVTGTRRLRNKL